LTVCKRTSQWQD